MSPIDAMPTCGCGEPLTTEEEFAAGMCWCCQSEAAHCQSEPPPMPHIHPAFLPALRMVWGHA